MSNKNIELGSLGWGDRFALIDHYKPTDETIMEVFGIDANELETAREFRKAGTFTVNKNLDVKPYAEAFANPTSSVTSHKPARSATKAAVTKAVTKRGKRGNKIQTAFAAITAKAVPAETFAKKHGVSLAVLRQAKRFDKTGGGVVHVKKDKNNGKLMIWREIA